MKTKIKNAITMTIFTDDNLLVIMTEEVACRRQLVEWKKNCYKSGECVIIVGNEKVICKVKGKME